MQAHQTEPFTYFPYRLARHSRHQQILCPVARRRFRIAGQQVTNPAPATKNGSRSRRLRLPCLSTKVVDNSVSEPLVVVASPYQHWPVKDRSIHGRMLRALKRVSLRHLSSKAQQCLKAFAIPSRQDETLVVQQPYRVITSIQRLHLADLFKVNDCGAMDAGKIGWQYS